MSLLYGCIAARRLHVRDASNSVQEEQSDLYRKASTFLSAFLSLLPLTISCQQTKEVAAIRNTTKYGTWLATCEKLLSQLSPSSLTKGTGPDGRRRFLHSCPLRAVPPTRAQPKLLRRHQPVRRLVVLPPRSSATILNNHSAAFTT